MTDDIRSSEKWRNKANFDQAVTDAGRAQQQNISVEQLAKNNKAERLARMPDVVEPENQVFYSRAVSCGLWI